MPYIPQKDRAEIVKGRNAKTAGELNFMFSVLARLYVVEHGLSYQTINDVVGAFDCAKDEFKRKVYFPYEDQKIATNGGLYETLFKRADVGDQELQRPSVREGSSDAAEPGA